MGNLLRSGYKMLNLACPICNNPIFESKEGKKFCPVCEREVIIKNKTKNENRKSLESEPEDKKETEKKNIPLHEKDLNHLMDILLKKINWIGNEIEKEFQMDSIRNYCKTIKELYNLYIELNRKID